MITFHFVNSLWFLYNLSRFNLIVVLEFGIWVMCLSSSQSNLLLSSWLRIEVQCNNISHHLLFNRERMFGMRLDTNDFMCLAYISIAGESLPKVREKNWCSSPSERDVIVDQWECKAALYIYNDIYLWFQWCRNQCPLTLTVNLMLHIL